jgi:hypothetical protein
MEEWEGREVFVVSWGIAETQAALVRSISRMIQTVVEKNKAVSETIQVFGTNLEPLKPCLRSGPLISNDDACFASIVKIIFHFGAEYVQLRKCTR